MKYKTLFEVLFESEITIELILFLNKRARKKEDFLVTFNLDEKSFFTQIEMLKEYYLINENDNLYSLTTIGGLIANKLLSVLDAASKAECIEEVDFNKCSTNTFPF